MRKILIIVAGALILCIGIFGFVKFVKVQNIVCQSQYGECDLNLKSNILNLKNKNVWETRQGLVSLLGKDKMVLQYLIQFEIPWNFKVSVIEKKPIAAFSLKDGSFALVDADGEVVERTKNTSLPKLTSTDLDRSQIEFVVNLISRLYSFYGTAAGKVTSTGLEVNGIDGKHVIFPLSGDQDVLLGSLVLILSRLPSVSEATTINTIDLRFKNPILR